MNWLIWKEYRLQRLVMAVGLFLLLVPYSIPIFVLLQDPSRSGNWEGAPVFSLVLSVLTLALLGGNAIASERADRSAEYLGYQPVSRRQIVLSKLALPLATATVVWCVNLVAMVLFARWEFELLGVVAGYGSAGLCAFGVSWLVSSFQSSPTFAAASGIMSPFAVLSVIGLVVWLAEIDPGPIIGISSVVSFTILGLLSLVGGTWLYLHRVEP